MNTYDWLSSMGVDDINGTDIVEVSFKNGARKQFFRNPTQPRCITGDMVLVDVGGGYDIGRISLSGELVNMQMKKRRVGADAVTQDVIRKANERDLERLQEAREAELPMMVRARAVARTLSLNMKIGDLEFQGDKRKATFYYTATGRIDFRELIRHYAKEFRIKVEMRQIGARQEAARIGGIGVCGRELCCSTWLTDFKSVSTSAARYQNLAINQSKLSGQCGRLKCCLNYELDTYLDALEHFPRHADRIETEAGRAILVKTDIFKGLMFYTYEKNRGKFYALTVAQVKEMQALLSQGIRPTELSETLVVVTNDDGDEEAGYADVTGAVELPDEKRRKKKKKARPQGGGGGSREAGSNSARRPARPTQEGAAQQDTPAQQSGRKPNEQGRNRDNNRQDRGRNKERAPQNQNKPAQSDNPGSSEKQPNQRDGQKPQQQNRRPDNRPDNRQEKKGDKRPDNRTPKPKQPDAPSNDSSPRPNSDGNAGGSGNAEQGKGKGGGNRRGRGGNRRNNNNNNRDGGGGGGGGGEA